MNHENVNSAHRVDDSLRRDIETEPNQSAIDKEILESERAQSVLPYLTLNKLSEHEIASILSFADEPIRKVATTDYYKIDPFENILKTGRTIATLIGEVDSWDNSGKISQKLQQARKLFAASVLDASQNENPKIQENIRRAFFGASTDITSYCGGLRGTLELLTIAERTQHTTSIDNLYDEIIYDYSFSKHNSFETILDESSPIQQLRLLPIYSYIALRCDPDGWSQGALDKILQTLKNLQAKPDTKPLIKIVTESINNNIQNRLSEEWVSIDPSNPKHAEMIAKDQKRREIAAQEQAQLHLDYPTLPEQRLLTIIAPDIAATFSHNGIDIISDQNGHTASMLKYSKKNHFGIDQNASSLLSAAHNPEIKNIINNKLSIKLEEIPLDAQIQLLKFMTEANNQRFNALCHTMQSIDEPLRLKLAENFLAADFGEDFGDALLVIAESDQFTDAEKAKILDTLSSCRQSIHGITDLYSDIHDGQFTKQYARAANERLTDAVTAFREIAQTGTAEADLDWAGHPKFDSNSAIEALEYEEKSLKIINGVLQDVSSGAEGSFAELILKPDRLIAKDNRSMYSLYSKNFGYVLLYTRPEGSHSFNPAIEYGKNGSRYSFDSNNTGVEASISFITNPNAPYALPNPFRTRKDAPYDESKSNKVSAIRLDREGRTAEMAPNDPERDVNRPQGICSVDLAAIGDAPKTPSGMIARLLSVGGKIRAKANGTESSLNHNTKWFNQEQYGSADGFHKLVLYLDSIVTDWCNENPPDDNDDHSFKYQTKLKMGHKVRRTSKRVA